MKKLILIISAVVCVLAICLISSGEIDRTLYPVKYKDTVMSAAEEYGINPDLLFAVIRTESSFDPSAVSSANAKGLTQITEDTFEWLMTKTGEEYVHDDLFRPEISVKYGALFLGMLVDEFEDVPTALAAYHAGRGDVNEWLNDTRYSSDGKTLDSIPIDETAHYVSKVTKAMERYSEIYDF